MSSMSSNAASPARVHMLRQPSMHNQQVDKAQAAANGAIFSQMQMNYEFNQNSNPNGLELAGFCSPSQISGLWQSMHFPMFILIDLLQDQHPLPYHNAAASNRRSIYSRRFTSHIISSWIPTNIWLRDHRSLSISIWRRQATTTAGTIHPHSTWCRHWIAIRRHLLNRQVTGRVRSHRTRFPTGPRLDNRQPTRITTLQTPIKRTKAPKLFTYNHPRGLIDEDKALRRKCT